MFIDTQIILVYSSFYPSFFMVGSFSAPRIAILLQKEGCKHCGRLWIDHEGVVAL